MKLKNKIAIVTGGANGIGRAVSLGLAREGADVVIADIEVESANKVADEIRALGRRTMPIELDVTRSEDAERMAKAVLDKFGAIDILVNCAGGPAPENTLFHKSEEKVWDQVIDVNLKGTRNCARAVINHMMVRRSGKIVNIASIAGMLGSPCKTEYSAAKAGIIGFTMSLAKEVASYGITVNSVSPGPTLTRSLQIIPGTVERGTRATGFGRIGKPEEVAALIVFLVSDDASFISGQNYPICGLNNLITINLSMPETVSD